MIFEGFRGFGFVHHRALNDHAAYSNSRNNLGDYPDRTHIFEGDLCWDANGSEVLFYFRHPTAVFDKLPRSTIELALARKELVGLGDLERIKDSCAYVLIELKVGRGDWRRALAVLVDRLHAEFPNRFWIDGFSLRYLDYIKEISPATPVTLHTEFVYRGSALVGAPEWPPVKLKRIASLASIDGIAIRRRGSETFMTAACSDVHSAGKALILSRLHTLREFDLAVSWGAVAGYMHWNFRELVAHYDDLLNRHDKPTGSTAA